MNFDEILYTNILVVGSGIAGTCAAVSAAETYSAAAENDSDGRIVPEKAAVTLVSAGPLFSGSSFFEGTWGLGLVAPDGPDDVEDFAQTILRVGCGAAQENLVRSFVAGISPAITQLESWGVKLREPSGDAASQREYVPCFDHKHRAWRGIERAPYVQAMGQQLAQHGVRICTGLELLDIKMTRGQAPCHLFKDAPLTPLEGELAGAQRLTEGSPAENTHFALFYNAQKEAFTLIHFDALVLATGGTGTLYSRHLTRDDNVATTLGLAAELGCELTNLEFIQFMPGIVSPVSGVIFNEKTFRFMKLPEQAAKELGGAESAATLLDQRSGYGPFTSRLDSSAIDFAICKAGAEGLALTPDFPADAELPEFVRTYQEWLKNEAGVSAQTPLRVAHYAHANNGGIRIDEHAATSVPGIFAAGECTGGMHGADRIGGLSSANGLVFGLRAGKSAAAYALQHNGKSAGNLSRIQMMKQMPGVCPAGIDTQLTHIMDSYASVVRSVKGLQKAQEELQELAEKLQVDNICETPAQIAMARRQELRIKTAQLLVNAMLARPTSCGSHYITHA